MSIDDDEVLHPHLRMQEVAAMRLVGPGGRDERDAPSFAAAKLDLTIRSGARENPRTREKALRGEVVASAGTIDEVQGDRDSGPQVDRLRCEIEAPYIDRLDGGLSRDGARERDRQQASR